MRASDDAIERVVHNKEHTEALVGSIRVLPIDTQPIDEPMASSQLVADYGEFLSTRYFQEVAIPQGHGDAIHVLLSRNSRRFALFSATRHKSVGLITDAFLGLSSNPSSEPEGRSCRVFRLDVAHR